ncbi:neuritin-like [Hemicordylus capensis]|uniref:neuritin-like n=1 Tax=Hemicordylus capensis TaxID=884348 RepID=UPI002304335E|nr:neuritin-like [Hemicordylus capensis]
MGQALGMGAALLLVTLGYLLRSLTAETQCENIYQDFSDCILKLGENMASYEEEEGDEEEEGSQMQGLYTVCGYWDEFHSCAVTALWECQKEAATIWEMLKKESRKIKFQGSLFDLCASGDSQNFSSVQIPTIPLLSITLMVTWLNL